MRERERENTKNWTKWKILELYATYNNFGLRKQHGKLMEWYFTLKSFYAYEHLVCAWMALKRTWKKCGAKEKCEPFRRRKEGERKSNESVYSFRHIDCKCDNMWVFFCRPWALLINLCVSKHLSPISRPPYLLLQAGIQQEAIKLLLVQSSPAYT